MTSKEIKDLKAEVKVLKFELLRRHYYREVFKNEIPYTDDSGIKECYLRLLEKQEELKEAIHEKLTK